VRTVYDVDGAARPDPLPETDAVRGPNGVLLAGDTPVLAQYVLAGGGTDVGGTLLASDAAGTSLFRVNGPVVILSHVTGLYKNDTWSGKKVTYQRVECTGGSVTVALQGDAALFKRPQTVTASEGGAVVGRAVIPVDGQTKLRVPLRPSRGEVCTVVFTVGRTAVPGPQDRRRLGAHFLSFTPHR
jgi:hypothetical protein